MELNDIRKIPMFFILGRPRSGTTLLSALFDAHPNVKIPPEFPIFLSLVQRFKRVKRWDEKTLRMFVEHIYTNNVFNHRTLENLKVDREALTANLLSLGPEASLADLLKVFNYSTYSLFPKNQIRLIGDKNPLYSIYISRFLNVFPDARFVCITRDYRDNFISMQHLADLKLEAPILSLQVTRWRFVAREFLQYKKRYPDRFYLVRYEDVVTRQEEALRGVCGFLGLPFDPAVFDFFKKKDETLRIYPKELVERIHKSLMNPINPSRMGLWKKELTPRQVRVADQVAGKYTDLLGYQRVDPAFHPFIYLRTRPLAIYGTLLFKFYQFGSYLPYKISGWISIRLLILVRTYNFFVGKK
ncbi:MAG: sulfotransferase [bacterium]